MKEQYTSSNMTLKRSFDVFDMHNDLNSYDNERIRDDLVRLKSMKVSDYLSKIENKTEDDDKKESEEIESKNTFNPESPREQEVTYDLKKEFEFSPYQFVFGVLEGEESLVSNSSKETEKLNEPEKSKANLKSNRQEKAKISEKQQTEKGSGNQEKSDQSDVNKPFSNYKEELSNCKMNSINEKQGPVTLLHKSKIPVNDNNVCLTFVCSRSKRRVYRSR